MRRLIFAPNPLDIYSFENKCAKHKGDIKMDKIWTFSGAYELVTVSQSRNQSVLHTSPLSPLPEWQALCFLLLMLQQGSALQHYDGTAPRPWHLQEQRTFCRRFGGTATSTSKTFHISLLRVSQSLQQLDFFLKCIPFKNISLYCREDLLCPVPPSACISHSTQQNGAGSVHQESS